MTRSPGGVGALEHVGEHVARLHQRTRLDQALGHQQQRRLQRDFVGVEAERAIDHLEAAAVGALLVPIACGLHEQRRGLGGERRAAHPGVGPISATSSAAQAR